MRHYALSTGEQLPLVFTSVLLKVHVCRYIMPCRLLRSYTRSSTSNLSVKERIKFYSSSLEWSHLLRPSTLSHVSHQCGFNRAICIRRRAQHYAAALYAILSCPLSLYFLLSKSHTAISSQNETRLVSLPSALASKKSNGSLNWRQVHISNNHPISRLEVN